VSIIGATLDGPTVVSLAYSDAVQYNGSAVPTGWVIGGHADYVESARQTGPTSLVLNTKGVVIAASSVSIAPGNNPVQPVGGGFILGYDGTL